MATPEFLPGDVVSVNVPNDGQREGLVIGTTIDAVGRQVVEIQFDRPNYYYRALYPYVRRVARKTVGGSYPYAYPHYHKVERQIHYDF